MEGDDEFARSLQVNRTREMATEDAHWILAFYKPLIDGGIEPDDAISLTHQWLEAQMAPQIIEVSTSDECGVGE